MAEPERNPAALIERGCLEKCEDFEHEGRRVLASRLGYRITRRFVNSFFGRIFNHPHVVFTDEMLRPELQDRAIFADAMDNIVTTQKSVAQRYFNDGSIDSACPPLRALLHIMRDGDFEGRGLSHPEIRALFTRENLLASDWYAARLKAKQASGTKLWTNHVEYLKKFLSLSSHADEAGRLKIEDRLSDALKSLEFVKSAAYIDHLRGSIGAQPL